MNTPKELQYTRSHEWIRFVATDAAEIGLTDFAQDQLGDLVFVELPEVGDEVICGESFGDVESVKAVSDIYCPVSGVVTEVNEEVLDNAGLINEDPYGTWLIRVGEISGQEELLDAEEYDAVCQEEA